MRWTRFQVKEKAKNMLGRAYWSCVLVAFILTIVGGSYTSSSIRGWSNSATRLQRYQNQQNIRNRYQNNFNNNYNLNFGKNGSNQVAMGAIGESEPVALMSDGDMAAIMAIVVGLLAIYGIIIIAGIVVGCLLKAFLFNPLVVGGYHFYLNNSQDVGRVRSLGMVFGSGCYLNVVKVMFLRDLYRSLWYMLLIIPGVIKDYEYSMIPYLLAYDPSMRSSEVFAKTKEMTNGEKWNIFLLKWSFIGWDFLNAFTLDLLKIFFLEPYKQATFAELFLTLGGKDPQYMQGFHGITYYAYQQSGSLHEYKQI